MSPLGGNTAVFMTKTQQKRFQLLVLFLRWFSSKMSDVSGLATQGAGGQAAEGGGGHRRRQPDPPPQQQGRVPARSRPQHQDPERIRKITPQLLSNFCF